MCVLIRSLLTMPMEVSWNNCLFFPVYSTDFNVFVATHSEVIGAFICVRDNMGKICIRHD